MARRDTLGLTAVRTEGAILPPSILQRIHREDASLGGIKPQEYGLSGERIREAASRAWNALQTPWQIFKKEREKLSEGEAGTGMTRSRWLSQVTKALDYGPLDPLRSKGVQVKDREFANSHMYGHVPMHMVGCGLDLDKKPLGVSGAARMTPHGMMQLLLNASDLHLWGFVSNGLRWRILRDSQSLSRQAMVEFDLEAIFEGQLYDEFLLFYLLCHQSRVTSERPEDCWLEKWSQSAGEEGKRALDTLRDGVQKAIEALGQGFLKVAANRTLHERIRSGELDKQDYYRQLLRMVYRLLFLFVAEDRNLLLDPMTTNEARRIYIDFYSTQRFRLLAERLRGSARHHDLYDQLKLVFDKLGQDDGCPELGLPALGGFLFSDQTTPDLDASALSNSDFLKALRCIAVTEEGGRRTRVDYKNLGSEELGSVYESLLELHPDLDSSGSHFELKSASGNERKSTGSYYTPDSLIQCLLDTALEPVVDQAVHNARIRFQLKDGESPEAQAILALKIIDPAVGSGHFLIAAAHRLARRLAQARTVEEEPSPEATRHALRDVIRHCLYGIDLNPMAAELCKVALWMESLEPGKPLGFLDAHIQIGNSLIGTTPQLIAEGIPDAAYDPIEGDDKARCTELKRQNRAEREGLGGLFGEEDKEERQRLAAAVHALDSATDDISGQRLVERNYHALHTSEAFKKQKLLADAWCAAFMLPKLPRNEEGIAVTTEDLRHFANGVSSRNENEKVREEAIKAGIKDISARFVFLHPHLAFPDVFASGGFDVVIGNPPWEQIQFQPEEFFAVSAPEIARAPNMAARNRLITHLKTVGSSIYNDYRWEVKRLNAFQSFIHASGRFPFTSFGRLNTAPLFCELGRKLLNRYGRCGIVVPSGIATDSFNQHFFANLIGDLALSSLYDFENGKREEEEENNDEDQEDVVKPIKNKRKVSTGERLLFPAVDSRFKFCLLTMTGTAVQANEPQFAFFCHRVTDLSIPGKIFTLTPEDIALLNPNTRTCPVFRTQRDADITKTIYRRVPVLIRENDAAGNPWGIKFQLMFMMNTASHLFRTHEELQEADGMLEGNRWTVPAAVSVNGREIAAGRWLPLYEAKMVHHFDHRWATYETVTVAKGKKEAGDLATRDVTIAEKQNPDFVVQPRYWVAESEVDAKAASDAGWFIGFRDITNTTNERTAIFGIVPRAAVGNKLPLIGLNKPPILTTCFFVNCTSYVFDFITRQKMGGTSMNFYLIQQFVSLDPLAFNCTYAMTEGLTVAAWIASRILELTYTANDLASFALDLGYNGTPFTWDDDRRFWLRAELDAAFFHLYGIGRDDVDYIMETFPIVKRKDIAAHGSYRTKEAILEIYDAMAEAQRTGNPYQTKLDPPPANGWIPPALPPLDEDVKPEAKAAPLVKESGKAYLHPEPEDLVPVLPPEDLRLL